MKRWIVIGVITITIGSSAASAETPAVEGSSAAATEPESVAVTGETKSAPAPHAMTDRDEQVFVTLTRNAISLKELPSSVEMVKPEDFLKFDAQNVGDAVSRLA